MELIDKDAVVAEIEKTYNFHEKRGNIHDASICDVLYGLSHRINAIKVEDVDLKEEIDDYVNEYFSECDDGVLISDANSRELTLLDITPLAKHFFELGLSSQLSWQDVKRFSEIGETFMNSEESDNLSEEEYYTEILNKFKAQKGEKV